MGDPACDVMVAWKVRSANTPGALRAALSVDEATWARSRGWALSQALIALAYSTLETNPVLVREARRWLAWGPRGMNPVSFCGAFSPGVHTRSFDFVARPLPRADV